ncbi:hypothetical protein FQZ97_714560 [compost metagenome]
MRDQHEFALLAMAVRRQPGGALAHREGGDFLEAFGQLARHGQPAVGSADFQQIGQGGGEPMRRFEHHHRRGQGAPGAQPALAGGRLGRRETRERIRRVFVRGDTATHQRGDHGAGAGHRHDLETRLAHGAHNARARIADGGRPRVGHQGHALALLQPGANGLGRGSLVVAVGGHQRRAHAPGVQQRAACPRVFGSDHVGPLQGMPGAQPQVAQIADRRGHDVQRRGGPMLLGNAFGNAGPGVSGGRG